MKPGCALLIALLLAACSGAERTPQASEAKQSAAATTGDVPKGAVRPRRVLALHSEASDNPIHASFIRQFHAVLKQQSGNTVEYYVEHYDSERFPGEPQARLMRDYLRQKYADRKIDVLFPWGPFNLQFALKYRSELFPDTPIVYYTATLDEVRDYPLPPMTGVLNLDTYERTVDLVLRMHPDTKEVFVVSGTPQRDRSIEHDIAVQLEEFKDTVKLTYLTDLPLDRLLAIVKRLPRGSIILYSRQQHDEAGRVLQQSELVDLLSRSASVPLYGPWLSLIGYGSVGGVVDNRDAGAAKAAELVLRVARGARPEEIPPERTPRVATFDARQLQRWGISEDRLPPGSVVLNRELTLWGQYKVYISIAGLLIGLQSTFIAGLLVQRIRRRRAEALLQRSEQRYALATATGRVGVWDWDLETNEIYVDPALKRALGFDDHEIENRREAWEMRIHPEDADRARAAAQAHVDGRTPDYHSEHRVLHKDGSIRWFVAHASAVRLPDGRAVRVIGTDTDITELKVAEGRLAESQHELARVFRVSALGEFAASIAHELGHPLNAILLNAKASLRWLEDATPPIEEVRSALRDIADAGNLANEVVHRNRALFRHHTVDKQLLDVDSVIRDVTLIARVRLAKSHVQLETRVHEEVPLVCGDRVELQQVLLNLLLNAMDAMEAIDPRTRRLSIEAVLAGPLLVQVTVRDTGIGLKGVDLERMFAAFYTTKSDGTGVGLSISRTIVEAHGGRIWVEPNDGPGATFCFTIPVATGRPTGPAQPPRQTKAHGPRAQPRHPEAPHAAPPRPTRSSA